MELIALQRKFSFICVSRALFLQLFVYIHYIERFHKFLLGSAGIAQTQQLVQDIILNYQIKQSNQTQVSG